MLVNKMFCKKISAGHGSMWALKAVLWQNTRSPQAAKMYVIDNKRNIFKLHAGQCKMTVYTYKVCRYALNLVDLARPSRQLGKTVYRNGSESRDILPVWKGPG